MDIGDFLDRTVSIERQTTSADASGGTTRTFAVVASNVPAAIAPLSDRVMTDYARRQMEVDHAVYLMPVSGVTVKLGDRVNDGGTYYVVVGRKNWSNANLGIDAFVELHTLLRDA